MTGAAPMGGDLMVQVSKVFTNATIGQGYGEYDYLLLQKKY
jgi:hypothetical protein